MSQINTNAILDASGGTTTTVNGFTPTVSNMAGRNLIINGAMQVAQRGTSTTGVTTTDGYYACDRWRTQTDYGTWTISQNTDAPNGFANSLKMLCTSGGTSNSDEISLRYYFEGQDVQGLGYGTSDAKEVTASFWIKSNTTGTYTLRFYVQDTGTPEVSKTFTIDAADTWEYKTVTAPANTSYAVTNDNTFGFGLFWYFGAASGFTSTPLNETWNASVSANSVNSDIPGLGGSTNDYVNITGVQLEVGSVATPFEHRSYGEELASCQRYYQRYGNTQLYNRYAMGQCQTSTRCIAIQHLPVTMRSQPSLVTTGTIGNYGVFEAGSVRQLSNLSLDNNSTDKIIVYLCDISSGFTSGNAGELLNYGTVVYLDLNAEL